MIKLFGYDHAVNQYTNVTDCDDRLVPGETILSLEDVRSSGMHLGAGRGSIFIRMSQYDPGLVDWMLSHTSQTHLIWVLDESDHVVDNLIQILNQIDQSNVRYAVASSNVQTLKWVTLLKPCALLADFEEGELDDLQRWMHGKGMLFNSISSENAILVLNRAMSEGELVEQDDLVVGSAKQGISNELKNQIVGCKLRHNLPKGSTLSFGDLTLESNIHHV